MGGDGAPVGDQGTANFTQTFRGNSFILTNAAGEIVYTGINNGYYGTRFVSNTVAANTVAHRPSTRSTVCICKRHRRMNLISLESQQLTLPLAGEVEARSASG